MRTSRLLVIFILTLLSASPAAAHGDGIADVPGPGVAVSQPAAQCPRTTACTYGEQNLATAGYRLQRLEICGANCTTQYWVSSIADGQSLLAIDPTRGGAVVAIGRSASHPPVRVVMPSYAATDPACCPSAFADTTYTWDAASATLVPGEPVLTASSEFQGWDAVRAELQAEGWLVGGS
jgi:hypothetical protein